MTEEPNIIPATSMPWRLPAAATPDQMLDRAITQGASMEVIGRMMDLNDRWQAGRKREAFDAAMAEAKGSIPVIPKTARGHNAKPYADMAAIAKAVDPVLAQHGLSYRFRTRQDERLIHVTCIVAHRAGHYEENTLSGPADTSGSKNAIQSIGSTLTYLQRYCLMQALGLAASVENDDDGAAAGVKAPIIDTTTTVNAEQLEKLRSLIVRAENVTIESFCEKGQLDRIEDLLASRYDSAVQWLQERLPIDDGEPT